MAAKKKTDVPPDLMLPASIKDAISAFVDEAGKLGLTESQLEESRKKLLEAIAENYSKKLAEIQQLRRRFGILEGAAGFFGGTSCGKPAYRILGSDNWYPTLSTAIDKYADDRAAQDT